MLILTDWLNKYWSLCHSAEELYSYLEVVLSGQQRHINSYLTGRVQIVIGGCVSAQPTADRTLFIFRHIPNYDLQLYYIYYLAF